MFSKTVTFVTEEQAALVGLPADRQWVLARTVDDETYLFIRETAVSPDSLEEAWSAYTWLGKNRPAERPILPDVETINLSSDDLRRAVEMGHQA